MVAFLQASIVDVQLLSGVIGNEILLIGAGGS
jgi:hypothetical protein